MEKKYSIFLAAVGPATYRLLHSLIAPVKPGDKSYNETISSYVAELRSIAEYCNYGTTLEAMLRDRVVCGVYDKSTQKRLSKLKFTKDIEIAQGLETETKNMKDLSSSGKVHRQSSYIGLLEHSCMLLQSAVWLVRNLI